MEVKMEINETELKTILECSETETHEQLKELLKELTIKIKFKEHGLYFDEDRDTRNIYEITIRRDNKAIKFKFGDSIKNAEEGKEPRVYDILTCVKMDYNCPDNFKDFCEYGYDEDSRKAETTFKRSLRQSGKLHLILNDDEVKILPD